MGIFNLPPLYFIDRETGQTHQEEIYGEWSLALLYGKNPLAAPLRALAKLPFVSRLYGALQDRSSSRKKVTPFVKKYGLNSSEFAKESFLSFNDFFSRRLKPDARPISSADAVMPADGRYRVLPNIAKADGFVVKGKTFCLERLLGDVALADRYREGAMVMARLCPVDYHRFHFPVTAQAGPSQLINGHLASVNPFALAHNISIFTENRRSLCKLETEELGTVLMIEVGATNVGSITQNYRHGEVNKGDEKGYFSFGGSAILLLFEPETITFDPDLLDAMTKGLEVKCLMGQSLGKKARH